MRRRDFLQVAVAGSWGMGSGGLLFSAEEKKTASDGGLRFDEPFDGAIVHERCGSPILGMVGRRLKIRIAGSVPDRAGQVELVDAKHAERKGFRFVTEHGYKAVFPEEDVFERVRDRV